MPSDPITSNTVEPEPSTDKVVPEAEFAVLTLSTFNCGIRTDPESNDADMGNIVTFPDVV